VHNVYKGRQPVLIFAGSSPFTLEQELKGSRNEFIQWIQDVHDQRGILRGYTNYTNEFRTGKNIKQVTHRAFQFATSDPKGPVYLVGPREVMEEEVEPMKYDMSVWGPINAGALPPTGMTLHKTVDIRGKRDCAVTVDGKTSTRRHIVPWQESQCGYPTGQVVRPPLNRSS
jgi:acetolactate synthase-1/2/3 large subunit